MCGGVQLLSLCCTVIIRVPTSTSPTLAIPGLCLPTKRLRCPSQLTISRIGPTNEGGLNHLGVALSSGEHGEFKVIAITAIA